MNSNLNRRNFLKLSATGALASVARPVVSPALADEPRDLGNRRRKIAIIGAGLAGLAAAYELDNLGYEVVVLEAQMRAGGRVQTLREAFSDGMYAEAGAISLSDVDPITIDYIKKFNLPLEKSNPSGAPPRFFVRGQWVTNPMSAPYEFNANEKRLGLLGLYSHYVSSGVRRIGNIESKSWSPADAAEMDRLSAAEFLRRQGASKEAVEFLRLTLLGLYGDGIESSSALSAFLLEAHYQNSRNSYAIEGGNDLLPKAFARRLADKIHYGVAVTSLAQNENGVRVVGNHNGNPSVVKADYAVCALPLTMLRTIEITPPFPPAKRRAIGELKYSSVSRVYLQSRTRVWRKYHPTARAITDNPRAVIEDHTVIQPGRRGIVESHTFGPEARQVSAVPEKERLRASLRQLGKLFPGLETEFEGGVSKCWDEDSWSRGAYVDYRPGQMAEHFTQLALPEGRIYFAGEHTSKMFASMEGALESGRRVAGEIHSQHDK